MLKTIPGSEDGITIETYMAGQEYTLSDKLSQIMVEQLKAAVYFAPIEQKMETNSYENKSEIPSEDKNSLSRKLKIKRK